MAESIKKRQQRFLGRVILALTIAASIKADLPIHCIQSQIEGKWKLFLTKAEVIADPRKGSCGFNIPNSPYDAFLNVPREQFSSDNQFELELNKDNIAIQTQTEDHQEQKLQSNLFGKWTMVYDEAISIKLGKLDFFAFFQYGKENGVNVSYCNKTLIGFYRNEKTRENGCFWMNQVSRENPISATSLGNHIDGINLHLLRNARSQIIGDEEPKVAQPTSFAQVSATTFQSEDGLTPDTSEQVEPHEPVAVPQESNPPELSQEQQSSKHQHKKGAPTNIFQKMAKSLSFGRLKQTSVSKVLDQGKNMTRGKSFGVNNYLGYVAFFAQKDSEEIRGPNFSMLAQTSSKPQRLIAKHVSVPNTNELIFDFDPETMSKMGMVAQEDGSFIMGIGLTQYNGKTVLKGTPVGLKKENDIGDFIIAAQVSEQDVTITQKSSQIQLSTNEETNTVDTKNLVEFINQNNLGWKAAEYHHLKEGHIKMFKSQYRRKSKLSNLQDFVQSRSKGFEEKQKNQNKLIALSLVHEEEQIRLPKSLNLRKYLSKPRNQGNCGSCYLISTVGMLEARVRYLSKKTKEIDLSEQMLLDCNYFSQGCEGGFAFEVLRYINEFGVLGSECMSYKAGVRRCLNVCDSGQQFSHYGKRLGIKEYYYVGGNLGAGSEGQIMQEILKNGPVVANIEPTFDFQLYRSGVFKPMSGNTWQSYRPPNNTIDGQSILKEWTKVDHSILIYGWGETKDGVKYWRVMNSWGDLWGQKGSFKVLRGENSMGIESVVEAGVPDLDELQRCLKKWQKSF